VITGRSQPVPGLCARMRVERDESYRNGQACHSRRPEGFWSIVLISRQARSRRPILA